MTITETILIALIAVLMILLLISILFLFKNKDKNSNSVDMNEAINKNMQVLEEKLANSLKENANQIKNDSIKNLSETKEKFNEVKQQITKELTNNSEKMIEKYGFTINKIENDIKNFIDVTSELPQINKNLSSISELFNVTKNVGQVGESILENLIHDVIPNYDELVKKQYKIDKDRTVDFFIKNESGQNIAIDAKFPTIAYREALNNFEKNNGNHSENFKKSIKTRIDEASKYIDNSNKIDLVIVFIPSEKMYIDMMHWFGDSIREYATKKNVVLVSPTMIIALIKILLKIKKREDLIKNANLIINKIEKLTKNFDAWNTNWFKLISSFNNTLELVKKISINQKQIYLKISNITSQFKLETADEHEESYNSIKQIEKISTESIEENEIDFIETKNK